MTKPLQAEHEINMVIPYTDVGTMVEAARANIDGYLRRNRPKQIWHLKLTKYQKTNGNLELSYFAKSIPQSEYYGLFT